MFEQGTKNVTSYATDSTRSQVAVLQQSGHGRREHRRSRGQTLKASKEDENGQRTSCQQRLLKVCHWPNCKMSCARRHYRRMHKIREKHPPTPFLLLLWAVEDVVNHVPLFGWPVVCIPHGLLQQHQGQETTKATFKRRKHGFGRPRAEEFFLQLVLLTAKFFVVTSFHHCFIFLVRTGHLEGVLHWLRRGEQGCCEVVAFSLFEDISIRARFLLFLGSPKKVQEIS